LQERAHETNALINGLQRLLAPLLSAPDRTRDFFLCVVVWGAPLLLTENRNPKSQETGPKPTVPSQNRLLHAPYFACAGQQLARSHGRPTSADGGQSQGGEEGYLNGQFKDVAVLTAP
jgi:hypothetical protein